MHTYKTVRVGVEAEIVEKKSRFIANYKQVESEEDAISYIEEIKKKYWNARHNCYAFVIGGDNQPMMRCSDDGEPGGTAGKPMLEVLTGEGLENVVLVVTRYFGGTLLGTGGLVRAYQGAAKAGIQASQIITKIPGRMISIKTDYTGLGKIQYLVNQREIPVMDTIYTDMVELIVMSPLEKVGRLIAEIVEGTNGRAVIEEGDDCYYAQTEDGLEIFM